MLLDNISKEMKKGMDAFHETLKQIAQDIELIRESIDEIKRSKTLSEKRDENDT